MQAKQVGDYLVVEFLFLLACSENVFFLSDDSARSCNHLSIFSAECTIGMVRGLTPLKHYGTMALWHYGTMALWK